MSQWPSTERLAAFSAHRPWLVIAFWTVALAVAAVSATGIGGVLTTDMKFYVDKESQHADQLMKQRLGEEPKREFVVVQSDSQKVSDQAFQAVVGQLTGQLRAMAGSVAAVTNTFETGDSSLISPDGSTTLIPVVLKDGEAAELVKPILALTKSYDGKDGFTVVAGGDGSISRAFTDTSEKDMQTAEVIGMPIALVVLAVVFGALVAAGVPLALGMLSILIAIGITALIGRAFGLSTFVLNMISMIGLAVGIDYSLLIIQRFREERRRGLERDAAIAHAGATATRAVVFSGLTVIVALCGLLVVPDSVFRSLAVGAIVVVVVAILASTTLLPAALRLLGDRVDTLRIRIPGLSRGSSTNVGGGFWGRTTNLVTGHPAASIAASVALLLAAATPYLAIKLGSSGVTVLPAETSAARAFAILNSEFNAGMLSPARIVVDAPNVLSPRVNDEIGALRAALAADAEFGPPAVRYAPDQSLAVISVPIKGDPNGDLANAAISRLRKQYIPSAFASGQARAFVSGQTATTADYREVIGHYTPIVFTFVLGLSFVILLVVFRSIVVPIKAIVMNLLSVGAAYGLMVLVFQEGVGAQLFGFRQVDRIEAWVPLFMFAVLFGLSMDYHVFLLTRIREHFDETHDNLASVAFGVRTTAGMITGAALIMVSVFAGFAAGQLTMFQQMGFGLAVAVILDATIVRTVLVPASMALLGDLNWYLPSWLGWLPKISVEGGHRRLREA